MLVRGIVLPAVHPPFFWKNVNVELSFDIGTLKHRDGYPCIMNGFIRHGSTFPAINQELEDFFYPAAELDRETNELVITDEFVGAVMDYVNPSITRQGFFDTICQLRDEAISSGCDPEKDPQWRKMVSMFWGMERSKARGATDLDDVEQTRELLGFPAQ
jgi:hypothetical protein